MLILIPFLIYKVLQLQRQLHGVQNPGVQNPGVHGIGVHDVGVASRPDGSVVQLRRNQDGLPYVVLAPSGRVVHIWDCESVGVHGRELAVCRHCLARGGVRNPTEETEQKSTPQPTRRTSRQAAE